MTDMKCKYLAIFSDYTSAVVNDMHNLITMLKQKLESCEKKTLFSYRYNIFYVSVLNQKTVMKKKMGKRQKKRQR